VESFTEIAKIAGEFVGYVLVGVFGWLLVKFKKVAEERTKYPVRAIETSHRVRELMTEVRACFHADRVKIFQFKNGDYYTGGASEQKIVITHIVSRVGVGCTEGILRFQNVPVSLVGSFLKRAVDQKIHVTQVEEIDDDSVLKGFFLMNGTSTVMTCKLLKNRQLIGLLVVTWMEPLKNFKPKDGDLRELDTFMAYLEKLLA
jgi:hypothetical protein